MSRYSKRIGKSSSGRYPWHKFSGLGTKDIFDVSGLLIYEYVDFKCICCIKTFQAGWWLFLLFILINVLLLLLLCFKFTVKSPWKIWFRRGKSIKSIKATSLESKSPVTQRIYIRISFIILMRIICKWGLGNAVIYFYLISGIISWNFQDGGNLISTST